MIKNILSTAILAAAGVALSASSAMAQNPNYAPGDIVLFFQQFGGSNTVALNVGAATTFRDTTSNILNIANIGSLLSNSTTGFGSTWYDTSSLWWGAAGVRSNSTSLTSVTAGDVFGRTLYVSGLRTSLGTEGTAASAGWTVDSNGSMTSGANNIIQMANRMETQSLTTTLVEGTSTLTARTCSTSSAPRRSHSAYSPAACSAVSAPVRSAASAASPQRPRSISTVSSPRPLEGSLIPGRFVKASFKAPLSLNRMATFPISSPRFRSPRRWSPVSLSVPSPR